MKINTAKQKMRAGKPAFGYALGLGSPAVAEAMALTGIDFIMVDGQHGSYGPSGDSMIESFRAMAGGQAIPMARVARNDYTLIGRLLDEGALGIVVPMVHTPEQAKAAADACRFPPTGTRSWGYGRAATYGDDYTDWIDEQVFVAVQIESIQAVENAEAIMATPGVDGCFIGPTDLAMSMGLGRSGFEDHPQHRAAIARTLAACKQTGKLACSNTYTFAEFEEKLAAGFDALTFKSEADLFVASGGELATELRRRAGSK